MGKFTNKVIFESADGVFEIENNFPEGIHAFFSTKLIKLGQTVLKKRILLGRISIYFW